MIETIKNRIAELRQSDNNIIQEIYASEAWRNHIAHQGGIAELERLLAIATQSAETVQTDGNRDHKDMQ